jgi:hypothetical protein
MTNLLTSNTILMNPDFTNGDVRQAPITVSDIISPYLPRLWLNFFQIWLIS